MIRSWRSTLRSALLALSLLAAAACRNPDRAMLAHLVVTSAELRGMTTGRVAVIGGPVQGSADLVIVDDQGFEESFPVELRGATLGLLYDISVDPGFHGAVPIRIDEVDGPVTGDVLLARFRGSAVSVSVGLGGVDRSLRNRHGARLSHAYFAVGAGLFAGWEWLRIRLPTDPDPDDADAADPGA